MLTEKKAGNLLPHIYTFNPTDQNVRTVLMNKQPYFCAKDVCDILDIKNSRDALAKLDDDEKGVSVLATPSGDQEMQVVNESGLYHLIFKSRKPEAKVFRKWVTSEVLPQIRKTGRYTPTVVKRMQKVHDARQTPFQLVQLNGCNVKSIHIENVDWYSINDIHKAIGVSTECMTKVKQFPDLCCKIRFHGNTMPAWCTTRTGMQLILSGSRFLNHNTDKLTRIMNQPLVSLYETGR
jgi:prophage antirepressor-like protein